VGVRKFVGDFAISAASGSVADDPIDELGKGKDGTPSGDADTDNSDENEEWFEDKFGFGEEGETKVDENEVLGELRQDLEDKFGGELSASGHVVVGVVLHADTAEEERDDT
jgi:hypothetical protein